MPIRDREGRGKQRRVPLSDMIREEAEIAEREEMGEDRKFDPDRDLGGAFHGPNAFSRTMRDKDQLVLDELLASLPKNQGYYLKLYREIMPGKFEYKEQINNYDTWTDMELEIAERVKAMTRKFGSKKWGSGLYRVVVWRQGGIREANKYPITDIIVDAGDNEDAAANIHSGKVDPIEAANEQMNSLGNMLKAVEGIMPRAVDPNLQFQSIVQAFTSGRAEKQQAEVSSNNAMITMMTTMMTSMMGLVTAVMQGNKSSEAVAKPIEEQMTMMMNLMKSFGLGQQPQQQPKSLVEQITEMKMLGWDPMAKEDTLDQIAKLKAVTGALVDVMPSNGQVAERPGIFEKLIDSVAPHLPKIFSDMKAITENTALAQQLQRTRLADAGPQPTPVETRPTTRYGQPVGPQQRMGATDAFHEPPDMDPYSGFQTRPFQDPTVSDAGIRDEMTGSVGGATPEQMRAHFTGQQVQPTPVQPTGQRDPVADQLRAQAETRHDVVQPALPPLLQQLYLLIDGDKRDAYGALYDVLSNDQQTAIMITLAQQKQVTAQQLVQQLQETGFGEFQGKLFEQKANEYLSGFVRWVIENTVGKITSRCGLCGAEHIFESKYEFMRADAPVCGVEISGTETCAGILQLVVKDQQYVAAS